MENKTYTPEQITELQPNSIFVFGSNMNGNHAGGAAKTAVDKFGAINGKAIGLQGQSYALPTLSKKMQKLALSTIKKHLNDLNEFAKQNTNFTFFVTKIGCGICGYDIKDIAELFFSVEWNSNVILPIEFTKQEVEQVTKGFKAYEKGMICRGFQYKEGETYEHKGNLVLCPKESDIKRGAGGFHFCQNPLDTLDYYPLIDNDCNVTEFSEVEGVGEHKSDNNKICTKKIKIGAKLSLKNFTDLSLKFLFESVKTENKDNNNSAQLASSGYYAQLASSGDSAQLASSGDYAQLASSGDYAQLASSGYYAKLASSGYYAKLASSGYSAQLASSGYYAKLASSGYSAKLASSGDSAQLASSGDSAQLASSGDYAQLASSGDSAQLEAKGENSVIAAIGKNNIAKGVISTWITLAEYDSNNICICVLSKQIDGVELLADTFYKLQNGKFTKA